MENQPADDPERVSQESPKQPGQNEPNQTGQIPQPAQTPQPAHYEPNQPVAPNPYDPDQDSHAAQSEPVPYAEPSPILIDQPVQDGVAGYSYGIPGQESAAGGHANVPASILANPSHLPATVAPATNAPPQHAIPPFNAPHNEIPHLEVPHSEVPHQATAQPGAGGSNEPPAEISADNLKVFFKEWWKSAKQVCTSPNYFFEHMPREGGLTAPAVFLAVSAVGASMLQIIFSKDHDPYGAFFGAIFNMLVFFVLARLVVVLLKRFGGKGTVEATFRVLCYGSQPLIITGLAWFAPLGLIYMAYLWFVGLKKIHELKI